MRRSLVVTGDVKLVKVTDPRAPFARAIERISFRFVRHNDRNETFLTAADGEPGAPARLAERSSRMGAHLEAAGDEVAVRPLE
ncbi:MAG: hypothetical protein HY526_03775 [Betaproteobacteria bacterium]|nr:hypothetical protein [Betaproteobacteria bacterium]